jgi:hypothetical protein
MVANDADSHNVVLSVSFTCKNESKSAWDDLLKPTRTFFGTAKLDIPLCVYVADNDKGGGSSLAATFPHAGKFICREHRSETAAARFGKGYKVRFSPLYLFKLFLSRKIGDLQQFCERDDGHYAARGLPQDER